MAVVYARLVEALPNVANAADRAARFPQPQKYQKIYRLDTGNCELWTGATWTVIISGGVPAGLLFSGVGDPNGNFVAPVGSLYLQEDGGDGTVLWAKNSGSGNTGWRPIQLGLDVYNVQDFGATGDGTTDDYAAFVAAFATANGKKVVVPPGTYKLTARLEVTGNVDLAMDAAAKIVGSHGSNVLYFVPAAVSLGTVDAGATSTVVPIVGGGLTINALVGQWVEFATASTQRRQVLSNSTSALTFADALDVVPGAGVAATSFTPNDYIRMRGGWVTTASLNSTNIFIRYQNGVVVENVKSTGSNVNGLTLDNCYAPLVRGGEFTDSTGAFGVFLYMCTLGRIEGVYTARNAGIYGIEIKDCIDCAAVDCVSDADGTAFAIYCSGLNPSRDNQILGCRATASTGVAFAVTNQDNEGTTYSAIGASIDHCFADRCYGGAAVTEASTGMAQVSISDLTVQDTTQAEGVALTDTSGVQLTNIRALRCKSKGINLTGATKTTIRGGKLQDNNYNAGVNSAEIFVDATSSYTVVDGVEFTKTTATSKSTRGVQEQSGAANTKVLDSIVRQENGQVYSADSLLTGTGSVARAEAWMGTGYDGSTLSLANTTQRVPMFVGLAASTFVDGDTTPSVDPRVTNGKVYRTTNTAPTSITTFDTQLADQEITVITGDALTTLVQSPSLQLLAGKNRLLQSGETVTFVRTGSAWYEEGRRGGNRFALDGWYYTAAATLTTQEMTRATGRFADNVGGYITGLAVNTTLARTAGTLTIEVYKNTGLAGAAGAGTGLTAVLNVASTTRTQSVAVIGTLTYAAGDELYAVITTTGTWTPVTAVVTVTLEVTRTG